MPSPSRVTDEAGLSALCRALAPEQVQLTYCANDALPFRVEWQCDLGAVSFAGVTPDDAAERALASLASGRGLASTSASARERRASPSAPPTPALGVPAASPTEPAIQLGWAEAMHERIQELEERRPIEPRAATRSLVAPARATGERRSMLRLVR